MSFSLVYPTISTVSLISLIVVVNFLDGTWPVFHLKRIPPSYLVKQLLILVGELCSLFIVLYVYFYLWLPQTVPLLQALTLVFFALFLLSLFPVSFGSLVYSSDSTRSLSGWKITFLVFFLILLLFNGTFIFLVVIPLKRAFSPPELPSSPSRPSPAYKGFAIAVLLFLSLFSTIMISERLVFPPVDNARYFDSQLTYVLDDVPFHTRMNGYELRVVDKDLAINIMSKSNYLGSNTMIVDVHLGKVGNKTYWIGAVLFSGSLLLRQDMNFYQGFIAVDFIDPTAEPLVFKTNFYVGPSLILGRNLNRIVYSYNIDYIVGENIYFSIIDNQTVHLFAPYSIRALPFKDAQDAGWITHQNYKLGGVLELDANGTILHDYKPEDFTKIPPYGRVQYYSENWLELEIDKWGSSILAHHQFGTFTHLGGFLAAPLKMGIDDDVRVIVDPDTEEDIQFILLDSTGSENAVLRGAIKANQTGLYFYDLSQLGYIDTNTAHDHAATAVTKYFGTSQHGYTTLMPILYPIKENITSMKDYAYVVPLQFQNVRFGGIAITDPSDKTGLHTTVYIVDETAQTTNMNEILDKAIEAYLSESPSTPVTEQKYNFTIQQKSQYVENGYTVYVMTGNLSQANSSSIFMTLVFSQQYLLNKTQWITVVLAKEGQTLQVQFITVDQVNYVTWVALPS